MDLIIFSKRLKYIFNSLKLNWFLILEIHKKWSFKSLPNKIRDLLFVVVFLLVKFNFTFYILKYGFC